ncbi:UL16-binding protein 1 isoform X4 [Cricetulus griseus]|uniref:UL16-binding protein 1 isoform X4 n=1 Tax=Cricetulus griseus TaxID=10029 RepID=A0A9J7GUB8_CRIGR|nr:UL16-binding protein 1 isoform X4 [Cricetulus griseus]
MKWVAGIRFLVWSMLTWVLPVGECALSPSDAASLCYIFTVGKSGSGPWQHKVQGQLNEETFLSYNSINNCHVFGVLGIRLNATKICDKQVDTLKDGADLIKQQVIRMNNIIREPLTLQAKMHCWHDGDGHFNASWDIGLNGQKILHFDSSTGKLTEVGPGSSWIKELWEEDRHVTAFLTVTSQGDCRSWLQEVTLHLGKKLQPTASPTATPHVDQPPSSLAIKPNISVLLIILPYTLLCFPRGTLDNDRVKMLQRM